MALGSTITQITKSGLKPGLEFPSLVVSGVLTSTSYHGDGSFLTGVSGFATALHNDQETLLNHVFKTPELFHQVAAGTSQTIISDTVSGSIAFTRLSKIDIGTGATVRVAAGTTFKMNILGIFP